MLIDAMPGRRMSLAALAAVCGLGLAGCDSARFGFGSASTPRGRVAEAPPDVTPSVPSGSVTAEPLGPPPGGGTVPALGGGGGEVSPLGGSPQPVPTLGGGGSAPAAPSSRTAAVGAWTARDASGSCRVTLSSTPSLDLYRASAGGCPNKELGRVTSWDFRDGEVYLFQPGGAVAARLRPSGSGLTGVLAKSGAPLSLTRG
jgi:hypothetical protein